MLPNDKAHAIPARISNTIKPTPVTDKVTEFVVAPKLTSVETAILMLTFW